MNAVAKINKKIEFLEKKQDSLWKRLEKCSLCPRKCNVNRLKGQRGICGTDKELIVYAAFIHRGEEPPISGENGSGTIFFSGCSLRCIYCQNHEFSHKISGYTITHQELADIMLKLQDKKAHNINLVTPTHFLPLITAALIRAFKKGLTIPVVYNTSGYEDIEMVRILEHIVDIYLTDIKYIMPDTAHKLSNAMDYPHINRQAIIEMHNQKKNSYFSKGIMEEGIIIRHLIIPNHIEESKQILLWLKKYTPLSYISIMSQYQPYHKAYTHSDIKRRLTENEYYTIKDFVDKIGIEKGWFQEFDTASELAGIHILPGLLP